MASDTDGPSPVRPSPVGSGSKEDIHTDIIEMAASANEAHSIFCDVAQILDVVAREWAAEGQWSKWDQSVRDSISKWLTKAPPLLRAERTHAAAVRDVALALPPDEQHALARLLAGNVGYELIAEPHGLGDDPNADTASLLDFLYRLRASITDTGYRGYREPSVLTVEGWIATLAALPLIPPSNGES